MYEYILTEAAEEGYYYVHRIPLSDIGKNGIIDLTNVEVNHYKLINESQLQFIKSKPKSEISKALRAYFI